MCVHPATAVQVKIGPSLHMGFVCVFLRFRGGGVVPCSRWFEGKPRSFWLTLWANICLVQKLGSSFKTSQNGGTLKKTCMSFSLTPRGYSAGSFRVLQARQAPIRPFFLAQLSPKIVELCNQILPGPIFHRSHRSFRASDPLRKSPKVK